MLDSRIPLPKRNFRNLNSSEVITSELLIFGKRSEEDSIVKLFTSEELGITSENYRVTTILLLKFNLYQKRGRLQINPTFLNLFFLMKKNLDC